MIHKPMDNWQKEKLYEATNTKARQEKKPKYFDHTTGSTLKGKPEELVKSNPADRYTPRGS